ncbi:MAG: hypothetical protein ABIR68_00985, partial [Ilumatobacteraceae bacterium]
MTTTRLREQASSTPRRPLDDHRRPDTSRAAIDELRDLAGSDDFVRTLLRSAQLAAEVRYCSQPDRLIDDLDALTSTGPFAGMLAIELLGAIDHEAADESLTALLSAPHPLLRRHAAWRLRRRHVTRAAVPSLLDMLVVGGIDTMHAHRTLRRWSASDATTLDLAIARLAATGDGGQR